jgi:signal peptidase II
MSDTPSPAQTTLSFRAKIFWVVGIVGIDRWTKVLAIENLKDRPAEIYLGNFFRLEYAENPGAFLSLGASLSSETRYWVFAVAVGIFLLGAGWVLFRDKNLDRMTAFALAVVFGGGIGNLIDRVTRANHGVVDFLNMGIGGLRTGIFNVADMAIMLGVVLLGWRSLRGTDPSKAKN